MDYTNTDNRGYDILVGCGDKIINGLSVEPKELVATLRAEELVTDEIMEEIIELPATRTNNARKLYIAIKATVKQHPHKYEDFIAVLEKNTLLYGDLLRELKGAMEKTSSSSTNLASPRQMANWKLDFSKTIAIILKVLVVLLAAALCGWVYLNFESLTHSVKLSRQSKTLPYLSKSFVGREKEMRELMSAVEFATSNDKRIVNIIGSPGFGKSTLAIHVGHRFVDQGVCVHYVDLRDFQEGNIEQILTEKILKSAGKTVKRINFERLLEWARDREEDNLIILDNCDDILQTQKRKFQRSVDALVKSSQFHVKVVMTSREVVVHLDDFKQYKIHELSLGASVQLLDKKVDHQMLTRTESEQLANLTGHVPLALHVIGSLLNLAIDPPSPSTIIEELQKHPMVVLSPSELPETQRVNASISLSYKYLTDEQRTTACFLAFFPGSFTLDTLSAVVNEYNVRPSIAVDKKALKELLYMSLLENDNRAKRYQYHPLVRQFFVEQHKHRGESGIRAANNFMVGFQYHFSKQLYKYTVEFQVKYIDSVQFLDTERHNIQYLLDTTRDPISSLRHAYLITIDAIARATKSDFLKSRFTKEELSEILLRALSYLDEHILTFQERDVFTNVYDVSDKYFPQEEFYLRVYVKLVIACGNIVADVEGSERASMVLESRTRIIERLSKNKHNLLFSRQTHYHGNVDPKIPPDSAMLATRAQLRSFYVALSDQYLAIGNHSGVIQCQLRIMKDAQKCAVEQCAYREIGYIYWDINDKEAAAKFFELSLENDFHSQISKVEILLKLFSLYTHHGTERKESTLNRLVVVSSQIMEMEDQVFINNWKVVTETVTTLSQAYKKEEADVLEERLLAVMSNNKEFQLQPKDALQLLKNVAEDKNKTKIILWGNFLLKPFENYGHFSMQEQHSILNIHMIVSITIFQAWRISDGLNGIEYVYRNVSDKEGFEIEKLHSKACFYLILRFKYIYPCYNTTLDSLTTYPGVVLYNLPLGLAYIIFWVPVTLYHERIRPLLTDTIGQEDTTIEHELKSKEVVQSSNEMQSVLKDVIWTTGDNMYAHITSSMPVWPNIISLTALLDSAFIILSVSSIWIRLWLFFIAFYIITIIGLVFISFLHECLERVYYSIILNPLSSLTSVWFVIGLQKLLVFLIYVLSKFAIIMPLELGLSIIIRFFNMIAIILLYEYRYRRTIFKVACATALVSFVFVSYVIFNTAPL